MGMTISAVGNGYPPLEIPGNRVAQKVEIAPEPATPAPVQLEPLHISADQLEQVSLAFNKKLGFRFDDELNQVIVKVIDRETDKVIKEIPSEELQTLHLRIKEMIGLLFDETV
jgi:flagellar protein FlaG